MFVISSLFPRRCLASIPVLLLLALPLMAAGNKPCTVWTIVGDPTPASGDGGLATEASFYHPVGVAVGKDGSLYIADQYNHRIRRIDPDGMVSTIAGTGVKGFSGDGGSAASARLAFPRSVAVGPDGSIYFIDRSNVRVRRIRPDGVIETVAGNGQIGFGGESGVATEMAIEPSWAVAVDAAGNVFFSEWYNNRIRKVSPDGRLTTLAGSGPIGFLTGGFTGDGGPAAEALLKRPTFIAVAPDGSVFFADGGNYRIRRVGTDGIIQTVAGNGKWAASETDGDGGPATAAKVGMGSIAFDAAGVLYIAENGRVRTLAGGIISSLTGDVGANHLTIDNSGRLVFIDLSGVIHRRLESGAIERIGGQEPGDTEAGAPAEQVLVNPGALAVGSDGSVFMATSKIVYRRSPEGIVTRIAGTGETGPTEDGALARDATFMFISALAVGGDGEIYVADASQTRVFCIRSDGRVYRFAGDGNRIPGNPYEGIGSLATRAIVSSPSALAVDREGTVYISEGDRYHRILKVAPDGKLGMAFVLEGLSASAEDLAIDGSGNLYATYGVGLGIIRVSPDGGWGQLPGTVGTLGHPTALAIDQQGNLYLFDYYKNILWQRSPDGVLRIMHEQSLAGQSYGEGGPLSEVMLSRLTGDLEVDGQGNLLFTASSRVRKVSAPSSCPGPAPPLIGSLAVFNAASFRERRSKLAPGEIITVFGANLGPAQLAGATLDKDGKLATKAGGFRVMFDGVPAPIVYASRFQTSFVVPYEVAGSTDMQAEFDGVPARDTRTFGVAESQPDLFAFDSSGRGQGVILNEDGSYNGPDNPAKRGSIVVLYGTGEGRLQPAPATGEIVGAVLPKPVLPVAAKFGTVPGTVLYFGGVPGVVAGVFQTNVRIPRDAPVGDEVKVSVGVGDHWSSGAITVAIQ